MASPACVTPKYGSNVVGSRIWIRFTLDDNTKKLCGGFIADYKYKIDEPRIKNPAPTPQDTKQQESPNCTRCWNHVINFDDGEIISFDLDFEERHSNLYWSDQHDFAAIQDDGPKPILPPDDIKNEWIHPDYEIEEGEKEEDEEEDDDDDDDLPLKEGNKKRRARNMPYASVTRDKKKKKRSRKNPKQGDNSKPKETFGPEIVKREIMVHWTFKDKQSDWLRGRVTKFYDQGFKKYHQVKYVDGESVWHEAFPKDTKGMSFVYATDTQVVL